MSDRVQIPEPRIAWPPAHDPASAVVFAHNAVEIAASPEKVWSLLVDCVAWPGWYRHCSDVSVVRGGPTLQLGSIFRFRTLRSWFEPEVVRCDRPGMLVWSAKGPAGTSGSHAWSIESTPTGCRVVTEEVQTGLLLRLVRKRLRAELLACHEDWLRSLKALAEALEAS